ncbi:hypothetical protein GCM10009733_023120 [Nonomuraea maheshkhaliensis]|uniref:Uncharacterized protein n=1 Tax=Nonomuraea maheshkhaliensis TaxID=419590 RepID=A0ABP4QZI5_9ACTN
MAAQRYFAAGDADPSGALIDGVLPMPIHLPALIGAILPAWGLPVNASESLAWLSRYRTYQALRPLWRALCIALTPAGPALVETGDGTRSPPASLPPGHRDQGRPPGADAAPRPGHRHARAHQRRPGRGERPGPGRPRRGRRAPRRLHAKALGATAVSGPASHTPGGGDLDSDTVFLRDVARAFHRLERQSHHG